MIREIGNYCCLLLDDEDVPQRISASSGGLGADQLVLSASAVRLTVRAKMLFLRRLTKTEEASFHLWQQVVAMV